jgi:hypothetical protein
MAIGSGLAGSLGIKTESAYGTFGGAPDRFWEVDAAPIKYNKTTSMSKGLAAGRTIPLASRRQVVTRSGSGSFTMDVVNKTMGQLINNLFGGTVTPVQQAATAAYLQTHNLGATTDNFGKSFSAQVGIPDAAGTVRPYTFLGCKTTKAEFSCGAEEYLKIGVDVDARNVVESETLAAPSYVAATRPFHWADGSIKIADMGGSPAAVTGVRKVTLAIERKMDTGRFYYGAAGLKAEPILNDFTAITGSLDADYIDKTHFADRFANDTAFALVWEFIGPTIEGAHNFYIRFTMPACFFDDESPTLTGPDLIKSPMKFTVLNDGTNPPLKIELMSTDTTL